MERTHPADPDNARTTAIDEKLDDVLRGQKDDVLADMIGVGYDIDEAMTIREHGAG